VDVQVAEYGYINFATARSATATIDRSSRTITVELPTPTVRTYIHSVGDVKFSEGPLNAIGTMMKAPFASILGKPVVSVNISGELQAAQKAVGGKGNPVEIFKCGKNEIEQQLAGVFGSLPQYRGWPVVVQFSGMRSVPEGRCQALQNQLVHSNRANSAGAPGWRRPAGRWPARVTWTRLEAAARSFTRPSGTH